MSLTQNSSKGSFCPKVKKVYPHTPKLVHPRKVSNKQVIIEPLMRVVN